MTDSRWLRVMTVGLILAALAVGYFLISGKFGNNQASKNTQVKSAQPSVLGDGASPSPVVSPTATASAYTRIVERNMQDIQTLPNTAFPSSLLLVFSAGAIAAGLGLRRFPK